MSNNVLNINKQRFETIFYLLKENRISSEEAKVLLETDEPIMHNIIGKLCWFSDSPIDKMANQSEITSAIGFLKEIKNGRYFNHRGAPWSYCLPISLDSLKDRIFDSYTAH